MVDAKGREAAQRAWMTRPTVRGKVDDRDWRERLDDALTAYLQAAQPGWPEDAEFHFGQAVEKYTGEARWSGFVLAAYLTTRGKLRYVVEVQPQGFQMIATPDQLRPLPPVPAEEER